MWKWTKKGMKYSIEFSTSTTSAVQNHGFADMALWGFKSPRIKQEKKWMPYVTIHGVIKISFRSRIMMRLKSEFSNQDINASIEVA